MPDIQHFTEVHQKLHTWYKQHGRHHLPWRTTTDPYRIYISEVMLQQTQVATVLERYYFPFLERFPTFKALAEAPLQDVLKYWEGLGYYNRAANLHKAAQIANPTLPNSVETLIALPGIGRNTAHAVAAFAYQQPVPVMEANVKRVLCRVFAFTNPTENELWDAAFTLLDKEKTFDYNQAMMDIGSMVCTKANPSCLVCPLNSICQGQTAPHLFPTPKDKKVPPVRQKYIVVFTHNDHYLTIKRTSRFLHGLYGFMEYERDSNIIHFNTREYTLTPATFIGNVTQTYSHFTLEGAVHLIRLSNKENIEQGQWETEESLQALPLSRADIKVVKLLEQVNA